MIHARIRTISIGAIFYNLTTLSEDTFIMSHRERIPPSITTKYTTGNRLTGTFKKCDIKY
jgi:hypothetical protein